MRKQTRPVYGVDDVLAAMREKRDAARQVQEAAPELLAALQGTLQLARLKWGNLDADANTVFEQAEAAIAKATGAQQ